MLRTIIRRQLLNKPCQRFITSSSRRSYGLNWSKPMIKSGILIGGGIMAYQLGSITAHAEESPIVIVEEADLEIPDILIAENSSDAREIIAEELAEKIVEESAINGSTDQQTDASEKGAYDPETGEINWDCPCLGGMADGPCGEEFKSAFSCFVYSETDPKGSDCIEKFAGMQNCFRQHPDVYAEELKEDPLKEESNDDSASNSSASKPAPKESSSDNLVTNGSRAAPAPSSKAS